MKHRSAFGFKFDEALWTMDAGMLGERINAVLRGEPTMDEHKRSENHKMEVDDEFES